MLRLFCILTVWDYSVTLLCLEGWSKCFTWCVSVKLLCGLEASQGAVEEVLSSAASANTDALDSSDDLDPEEGENETKVARKKKNKRRKGFFFFFFQVSTLTPFWDYNHLTRVLTVMFECCLHRKYGEQWWEGVSRGHLVSALLLHSAWRCLQICPHLLECLDSHMYCSFLDKTLQKVKWFSSLIAWSCDNNVTDKWSASILPTNIFA